MAIAEIKYLLGNNGDRIPYIVADASAIPKGSYLELTDNMIVIAHAGNVDTPIVGIAAHEKVANDGHTEITAITNAVIKCTVLAGGSATLGDHVSMGNAAGEVNLSTTLDAEKGWSVGYSLQTAAAAETVFVRMRK